MEICLRIYALFLVCAVSGQHGLELRGLAEGSGRQLRAAAEGSGSDLTQV